MLGPSYLMRAGIDAPGALERVWEFEILPQVREAFFEADEWVRNQLSLASLRAGLQASDRP